MKKQLVSAVLALSLVATGCSAGKEAADGSNGSSTSTPKQGGTLTIARLSDANNLDPHFSSQINSMAIVERKVYEGLVYMDKNSTYKPALATEWKQVNDTTWEFKLRKGVTFHDGAPFNAEAVQKTIARVLDKKDPSPRANLFSMIKEVKAVDEFTVQLILEYPYAPLLSVLASAEGSIISPKAIQEIGKDLSKKPVGTGPYKFQSWTPGQEVVIVKNDSYWGEKANLDKVVFKAVPEGTTRIAMVETGEAQVAEQLPVTEIERVKASSSMTLGRFEAFATHHLGFNVTKKPFDDVRVRQAIAYAIDKDSIVKGVYNNVGKTTSSTLGGKVIGFSPNIKGYNYDLNKAKQLLAEAGYPNGFKATVFLNDNKERTNAAEVIQSQLKGIGIDLQVKVMEFGAYLDATSKGQAEMFLSGWGNATGDADYNQYNLFHSSSKGAPGNHSFYDNKEVDKLIEAGRREADPEKRKQIYEQVQAIEMKDLPLMPYLNSENLAAISKNVEGVWISPSGYIEINEIKMK